MPARGSAGWFRILGVSMRSSKAALSPERSRGSRSRLRALWILGLSGIGLGVPALARAEDESFDTARRGFFAGLGGVYAFEDTRGPFDDSAGVDARIGYRILPRWAAEVQLNWLEGFDSTRGPETELDTYLFTVNVKGYATTGRIQPYLLVGLGLLHVNTELFRLGPNLKSTENGFAARLGGGIDFYASDHFIVNLEATYVPSAGKVSEVRYGTLGLGFQHRF